MKEFHDSLEAAPLKTGDTVWQLKGGFKDFSQKWIVCEDFKAGWNDYVHCRRSDGTGAIHLHERKTITSK